MPVLTVIIGIKLPGGLMVYWLVMTLLTILQQWLSLGKKSGGNREPFRFCLKPSLCVCAIRISGVCRS